MIKMPVIVCKINITHTHHLITYASQPELNNV